MARWITTPSTLTSAYYETPERALRAHGIELRRRDGDGETVRPPLRIPDDGGRTELHFAPSDNPPAEVAALLMGVTRGKSVEGIAKIHTVRERYRITTPKGREPCAEVADDRVRSSLGLVEPPLPTGQSCSRAQRVHVVAAALPDRRLVTVAHSVLDDGALRPSGRIAIEDLLWAASGAPTIPKRTVTNVVGRCWPLPG